MILHLRVVPGFSIAAEERRRPELRSRPIIVGGLPQQRGVVREVSFMAQRCGVHAGMSLSQAHQHCPDGLFLTPDPPYYESLWKAVCEILQRHTPLVEPLELGQAVCDLSGCERQWHDGWEMAHVIAKQVWEGTAIAPWIGVASSRLVAQLASTTVGADGITVIDSGRERAFLADLPITMLPEVDPRLALTFQVLGLRTIGQLAALPASSVRQRFGALGERLHRYARGIDERPVSPPPTRPSVTARYDCEDGSLEEALTAIHQLAEECAVILQRSHRAGRLVRLRLEWEPSSHPPLPPEGRGAPCRCLSSCGCSPPHASREMTSAALPAPVSDRARMLSLPHRIHSMLPQPGSGSASSPGFSLPTGQTNQTLPGYPAEPPSPAYKLHDPPLEPVLQASLAVRIPISTPSPLVERGQQLLLRSWPRGDGEEEPHHKLRAIELEVSEFEAPIQCSFAEFNRLDQTGKLGGISPDRLQALVEQEQLFTARYGDAPFRHVTHLDPGNVLTERRFRWQTGLPAVGGQVRTPPSRTQRRRAIPTGTRTTRTATSGGGYDQAVLRADRGGVRG